MKITLFPFFTDEKIRASVRGDVITINGDEVDLAGVPEGFRLPGNATGNWWLQSGCVERRGNEIHVTLRLPVWLDSYEEYRIPPAPIVLTVKSGKVDIPNTRPPAEEPPQPLGGTNEDEAAING